MFLFLNASSFAGMPKRSFPYNSSCCENLAESLKENRQSMTRPFLALN